jgi:hypothetical protein
MTVLAFLTERAAVKKILEHLGLPATGPPKAPARWAAQLEAAGRAAKLRLVRAPRRARGTGAPGARLQRGVDWRWIS